MKSISDLDTTPIVFGDCQRIRVGVGDCFGPGGDRSELRAVQGLNFKAGSRHQRHGYAGGVATGTVGVGRPPAFPWVLFVPRYTRSGAGRPTASALAHQRARQPDNSPPATSMPKVRKISGSTKRTAYDCQVQRCGQVPVRWDEESDTLPSSLPAVPRGSYPCAGLLAGCFHDRLQCRNNLLALGSAIQVVVRVPRGLVLRRGLALSVACILVYNHFGGNWKKDEVGLYLLGAESE